MGEKCLVELFSIRKATLDDALALAALDKRIQASLAFAWTQGHFEAEMAKPFSTTLVMTDDETDSFIAGYLVFWIQGLDGEILSVGVDPKMRGLGFAQKLVDQARRELLRLGAARLLLNVRKSNAAALALYQKMHFNIMHIRKGFYSDGEDAYEMEVKLDGSISDSKWRI